MTATPPTPSVRTSFADRLAYLVSVVGSPFLILPVLILGATWRVASTPEQFLLWGSVALVFFTALPPAYVYNEVRAGRITDLHIQRREQRWSVFLVFLVSTVIGLTVYWMLGAPMPLITLALVVFASAVAAALITLFWKISIHAWVVAGSVTAFALLAADHRWWWALLLVPLTVWARVHRHRHSPAQGILGALAGIGVTYLLYRLLGQ